MVIFVNLVAYENGAIQAIPRNLLDPRRPIDTPPPIGEEYLVPYKHIHYDPAQILSKAARVLGISKISSYPTDLESTTIIVCYGQDIFIATRKPSGGFDTLSEDFSYGQLLASIAGLIIAIFMVRRFAESKALKDAWK